MRRNLINHPPGLSFRYLSYLLAVPSVSLEDHFTGNLANATDDPGTGISLLSRASQSLPPAILILSNLARPSNFHLQLCKHGGYACGASFSVVRKAYPRSFRFRLRAARFRRLREWYFLQTKSGVRRCTRASQGAGRKANESNGSWSNKATENTGCAWKSNGFGQGQWWLEDIFTKWASTAHQSGSKAKYTTVST